MAAQNAGFMTKMAISLKKYYQKTTTKKQMMALVTVMNMTQKIA